MQDKFYFINRDSFYGKAIPMPPFMLDSIAKEYDIPSTHLEAVYIKEAARGAFLPDGRIRILFEAHVFSKLTDGKYDREYPNLSSKRWNRNLYGRPGAHQYERLERAMDLDLEAALQSCSWGMFQIMGYNHIKAGYESVYDMFEAFKDSAEAQLRAFMHFIIEENLLNALRTWDLETFAYTYNGPGHNENRYIERLNEIRASISKNVLRIGSRGMRVKQLQTMLNKHGYKLKADGYYGEITAQSVKDFQSKNGLTVDGVVGAQTWSEIAVVRNQPTPLTKSKRVKGAAVAGTVGTGVTIESVTSWLSNAEKWKGTADRFVNSPLVDVVKEQQSNTVLMTALGLLLIGAAGYFIWTKVYDNKKADGVE